MSEAAELFWQMARQRPALESPYADHTLKRLFEAGAFIPFNSVAWMKFTWPVLELYLYEPAGRRDLAQEIEQHFDVVHRERPWDMPDCDWIIKVRMP